MAPPTPITLNLHVARLAADPARSRVYATVPASNSVVVIDTVSQTVTKTISIGSNPQGLAISADGSKLWVANSGSNAAAIGVIDLNTLATLPSLPAPNFPSDVEEGLAHQLYLTPSSQSGGIMRVDALTGMSQGSLGSFEVYAAGLIEISPNRKTLYFGNRGLSGSTLEKFDLTSTSTSPTQSVMLNGGNGEDLTLSHGGSMLVFPNGAGDGSPAYTTFEIATANLSSVFGSFGVGPYPHAAEWSNDDSLLYHSADTQSVIDIFDTHTFTLVGSIPLGSNPNDSGGYDVNDLVVDRTGTLLFVATEYYPGNGELRIYPTGRVDPVKPAPKSLVNVSTRLRTEPGDNSLIAGFVINGTESKNIVIRAIGPSLPVPGPLADPFLELYNNSNTSIAQNDNWTENRDAVVASGFAPRDDRESVILKTLQPGAYTAIVRGVGVTSGVTLVEVYDLSSETAAKVGNISSRGKVSNGADVMIGGFIVGGNQTTRVGVRAKGPSLTASGVTGALQDPSLQLRDVNGLLVAENDNWRSDQEQQIINARLAPPDDRESVILATLTTGNYTATVRGAGQETGVALVEIYNLEQSP